MRNYLMGCTRQTQIGLLPDIINHNNEAVKNEFEYIFDASLNRLTKSVYAPTGSVKAHFGEFVNLAVEYISIKNIDSLSETLQKAAAELTHNTFSCRFDTSLDESTYQNTSYCHNASIIAYDSQYNVYQKISLDSSKIIDISTYLDNDIITAIDNISIYAQDISNRMNAFSQDIADISSYMHNQLIPEFANVSTAAWKAYNDTNDLSVYVHSIQSEINDISSAAWTAYNNTNDLSIYVHSIQSIIDDVSNKAQTAYGYAYDVSILVHNSNLEQISDISVIAHNAFALSGINNVSIIDLSNNIDIVNTHITELDDDIINLNASIIELNASIIDLDANITVIDTSINELDASIVNLNSNIQNISINIDTLTMNVGNLSTNINDIKNASFQITYNSSIYNLSDIVQLIDWKNSITTQTINATLSDGTTTLLNVLCIGTVQPVTNLNYSLNQLTGDDSSIQNPEDYTDSDINDASNHFNSLL